MTRNLRIGAWVCALVAVPAAAAVPDMTTDMAYQLTTVWVPATAYGLTLITALNKIQK